MSYKKHLKEDHFAGIEPSLPGFSGKVGRPWMMINATIARSPTRRGYKKGSLNQALGVFCGGLSTKIHAACDTLGNPIRFILTGGEASDCAQALALLNSLKGSAILAGKGYDADYVVDEAEAMGAEVVTPSKSNREKSRDFNKERNLVECMLKKIKYLRRVATRCNKTSSPYLAFVSLAGTCI